MLNAVLFLARYTEAKPVKRTPLRPAYLGATLATLAALLSAQPAAAHVEVRPGVVERGAVAELQVELPELRPGPPPIGLEVEGAGIEVLSTRLLGLAGRESRWLVRLRADGPPGRVPIVLRAGFADGGAVEVDSGLTVVPRAAGEPFPVAGIVAGLLLAAGFAASALFLARRKA